MNVPRQKVALGARYRDPYRDVTAEVRGRHSGSFEMRDGVWAGHVDSFTSVDLEFGFGVPGTRGSRLTLTAQNVLNDRHAEFVGAPVIGRMLLTRVNHAF
jgi:iron complex outermembrane receptor protein